MENSYAEKEIQAYYDRFVQSFIENRDPRIDLEISALTQLQGPHLEKAQALILERLEKSPDSDAISCARAIHLSAAIPVMKRWLDEMRVSQVRGAWRTAGELAFNLYEFTKDESYIPDVVATVQKEGYSDFEYGVTWLRQMPLTLEGIAAVWQKYWRGRTIKDPNSWRESCAGYLREKIREPVGQVFLKSLPEDEQRELLELIGESYHQRLERKFRLEKYIYGRERYASEDVNRFDEYVRVGGSPVPGMTLRQIWKGHSAGIHGLSWAPDGRALASASRDDTLRIWQLNESSPAKVLQEKKEYSYSRHEVIHMAWTSHRGDHIAVLYNKYRTSKKDVYTLQEWNLESEKAASPFYETTDSRSMDDLIYIPYKRQFLFKFWNGLYLFDRATRQQKRILADHPGQFGPVAWSDSGRVLAIGYHDMKDPKTGFEYVSGLSGEGLHYDVLIYDTEEERLVHRFNTGHIQNINKMCWLPDAPILAVASADNSISIWDLQEEKRLALLESQGFVGGIIDLAVSADGSLLASMSHDDNLIRIWRTDRWEEVFALRAISGNSNCLTFHPSLPILATVCSLREPDDYSSNETPAGICIWEFDLQQFLGNPPFMEEFIRRETEIRTKLLQKEFTEDLEYIKVGGTPVRGVKLSNVLEGHTGNIQHVSWSPDGMYLASPSDDGTVRIWEEVTGKCLFTLEEGDKVRHCVWTPDGQDLVLGSNKRIRKWNLKSHETIDLLQDDYKSLDSLVFSPDGATLALAYGSNTIQLVETSTGQEIKRRIFDQQTNARIHLEWSEDGSRIVANPQPGFLQSLDAHTLETKKVITVPGARDPWYGFSFLYAKFGDRVAVGEEKKPIVILDLNSGQPVKELSESTAFTSGLVFSPDGRLLVSWCQDSSVYLWRTDTGQKLARIHEYSMRMMEPVYPAFHPVKPLLVTFCDKRRSLRIWEIDFNILLG